LREDAVLAVFEDMSESDTSNSESECNSKRGVKVKLMRKKFVITLKWIRLKMMRNAQGGDGLPVLRFSGRGGILFLKSMISQIKIQAFRPIQTKIAQFLIFSNYFFNFKLCNT
jgi:hypothetical protein